MDSTSSLLKKAGRLVSGAGHLSRPLEGPFVHAPYGHDPVWKYCNPQARLWAGDGPRPLFAEYGPDTDPETLLKQTGLAVLLGAGDSPLWRSLAGRENTALFVFEPDRRAGRAFVDGLDPEDVLGRDVFFILGRPPRYGLFLEEVFGQETMSLGFPAFFVERGYADRAGEAFGDTVERLEMLYYRYRIYPVEGYGRGKWNSPPRPMPRGYYFDQQKHFFENIPEYLTRPGVEELAGRTPGATAVVVGAGPSLAGRLEWLKSVRDQAVVICVNTALRALLAAGIEPHVCVTVDHAEHTEKAFAGLPVLEHAVHAAHCLAPMAPEVFKRIAWCGEVLPKPLPRRPTPEWYGSVLTMAWSLARLMGCGACAFVGAELSSDNAWHMSYSRGTHMARDGRGEGERPLVGRHPQLYPVESVSGSRRYTTLNFRDTALWLAARLEASGMALANTSPDSILNARGMAVDPAPAIPNPVDARAALAGVGTARAPEPSMAATAVSMADDGLATWREVERLAREAGARPGPDQAALDVFGLFESQSVNYLVQRFRGYSNSTFHRHFFQADDPGKRSRALADHFRHVADMAGYFQQILGRTRERLDHVDRL